MKCLVPALLLMFGACGEKGTMIRLGETTVLYQKSGEDKFALYCHRGENLVPDESERCSEAVFEGTFEALNLADVKGSQNMFILTSDGKKYLFHYTAPMLDGRPFSGYHQDGAGGVYFQTDEGKYLMDSTEGLPAPVDDYLRTGGSLDVFLFKQDGKWGVYRRFIKSGTNVFRPTEYQYVRLLPAECERVRYVCGDGASHFLVQVAGKWRIVDNYGRDRQMCNGFFGHDIKLNILIMLSFNRYSAVIFNIDNHREKNEWSFYGYIFIQIACYKRVANKKFITTCFLCKHLKLSLQKF